jgi:hypothetical protein
VTGTGEHGAFSNHEKRISRASMFTRQSASNNPISNLFNLRNLRNLRLYPQTSNPGTAYGILKLGFGRKFRKFRKLRKFKLGCCWLLGW